MKVFQRAGCGCIIIPVDEKSEIVVVYCGESDGLHFRGPEDAVLPENRVKAVWLNGSEHEEMFKQINRLLHLGRKFEILQQTIGIPAEHRS